MDFVLCFIFGFFFRFEWMRKGRIVRIENKRYLVFFLVEVEVFFEMFLYINEMVIINNYGVLLVFYI